MKDSRFIELVNLYIDRQISAEEAGELESELQANPRRRQVYQQYCRMHRATKLVYESFRQQVGATESALPGGAGAVARFEQKRRRRQVGWLYAAGGLAAAACVALAVVRVSQAGAPDGAFPTTVATRSAPAVTAPAPIQAVDQAAVAKPASLRNAVALEADYQALLAAMRREEQQRLMAAAQLMPGQPRVPASLFDDGVFDTRQVLPERDQRTFRGLRGTPNQPPVEFTAFQFQR